ncbi:MAG: Gfo/Idh/MocA family oxidoreductase, partial [Planctomycetota bacterium]
MSTPSKQSPSRRDFLRSSTAATLAGTAAAGLASAGLASAGSASAGPRPVQDGVLRIGLVGCGGRGGGAATNALRADPDVRLVALGDTFEDRALATREQLGKVLDIAERVQVDDAQVFTGFDAYKQVIDAVDVVLLATSPHFRPLHVAYAVERGKHLFVEKPVATDAVGVRSMLESCRKAAEKKLTVVSGLCYRYQFAKQETVERIH